MVFFTLIPSNYEHRHLSSRPARTVDKCHGVHALTRAKWQIHLCLFKSSGVIAGHRSVSMGTGDTEENSPWALSSDTWCCLRQTRLSCTYKCESRSEKLLFIYFSSQSQSGLSTPLAFTLLLSSFSFSSLHKDPFSHVARGHLLTHILFVCIAPLSRSLAIHSCYFEQQRCTDAALSVCTSESICYSCPPTAVTYCNYCTSAVKPPTAQSASWGYCTCSSTAQKHSLCISPLSQTLIHWHHYDPRHAYVLCVCVRVRVDAVSNTPLLAAHFLRGDLLQWQGSKYF